MTPMAHPRLLISAARKSSGKTLLTLGLTCALRARGLSVRLYKKGPDYIDPMWQKAASGLDSYNLDAYLMGHAACRESFLRHSQGMDLSLIEGNMGLHDSIDPEGEFSSAALARHLGAPVLLVMDSAGMNRNIAALVQGLQHFDPQVTIGGVVLNNVRGPRQEDKQVRAIETHCGLPVLGSLPVRQSPIILERHLGLITPREEAQAAEILDTLCELVATHVDLERVLSLAATAPALEAPPESSKVTDASSGPTRSTAVSAAVRIGVAMDPAFCFYYPDNLEALRAQGADLVPFNTLSDPALPDAVQALYLGGGFPESFLPELEANAPLRAAIAAQIEAGMPVYAECGGMMYLTRSITREGHTGRMVGVIPADIQFQKRPVGYGYAELAPRGQEGWFRLQRDIRAHEFHYSRLVNPHPSLRYFYAVKRGAGMGSPSQGDAPTGAPVATDTASTEAVDGIVYKNLLASYAHLHAATVPEWSRDFVAIARSWRNGR